MIEIESQEAATTWLAERQRRPAAFQAVDLRHVPGFDRETDTSAGERFEDCLFLSCDLDPQQAAHVTEHGSTVIRDHHSRPYATYRSRLYTPEELFAGFDPDGPGDYSQTWDAKVYAHWVSTGRQYPPSIGESLARRIHDASISETLDDSLAGTKPIAIMGGHGMLRASPEYRRVAELSRRLARVGNLMLSGGGPGAMEATHLGAWFASFPDDQLELALEVLGVRPPDASPVGEYADGDWLHRAFAVRRRWPLPDEPFESIGVPTWAYGHEPPAAFATKIAKYFANSVREDGLLAIATSGIVFTPGSAGTIQEIFQDAAQNHYATFGPASPMVLLGRRYWTEKFPVWPVLERLAERHDYRHLIVLTDDLDEVAETLEAHQR